MQTTYYAFSPFYLSRQNLPAKFKKQQLHSLPGNVIIASLHLCNALFNLYHFLYFTMELRHIQVLPQLLR